MNESFLKGFNKLAEPELVKQTATGVDWQKPNEYRYQRQKILERHEQASKKSGFSKKAFLSLPHIAALFSLPSIERRVAEKSFEHSKRKAMGLATDSSLILDKIDEHLIKVEKMPKGLKKSVANFFMKEGPGLIAYAPAKHGKQLGQTLNSVAEALPLGLGKKESTKEFLAALTHSDSDKASKAMKNLAQGADKLRKGSKVVGYGALGLIGAALIASMLKKDEAQFAPPSQAH